MEKTCCIPLVLSQIMITSGFTVIMSEYSNRLSRRLYLDIPILWLCSFSPGGGLYSVSEDFIAGEMNE